MEAIVQIVGSIIMRLGILALALFLAGCLGLMDYVLIKHGLPLLHVGHHQPFEWEALRIIDLISGGAVALVCGAGSIGVAGWGIGCAVRIE